MDILICGGLLLCLAVFFSCASSAATAEEYFSIGMAYYELGKFPEAERWLIKASSSNKTMTASEYNLGRIAFESRRYTDAAKHFEQVLSKDPDNIMALKAAAYTYIKIGDLQKAGTTYNRVLGLVPESADDGFNYALVLYTMEKYEDAEQVLKKYPVALDEKPDALLLLARAQSKINKVEAIDNFDKWLSSSTNQDPRVIYEYAQILEREELYARALEQYRLCLAGLREDQTEPKKSRVFFDTARLLLIADPGNPEGISELNAAISSGFDDIPALEQLLEDNRIEENQKSDIRTAINNIINPPQAVSETDPEGGSDSPQE